MLHESVHLAKTWQFASSAHFSPSLATHPKGWALREFFSKGNSTCNQEAKVLIVELTLHI